ncbi:MAG: glycosyltransferase [Alphaproteobacteria bacterium]
MLDAAAALPEARFVFVGDGPRLAWVQEQVAARALANISFLPFQPEAKLAESLSAADLHLVTMEPHLSGLVVPSKVYGVMAAGRPCLFLGPADSEAARLLQDHDAGSVVEGDLAATIRAWLSDTDRRHEAGARARAAAEAWGPTNAAEKFDTVLRQAIGQR